MDKETLSNYGWIVICVLVLAVMLAFATPFGQFIATAVQSTTQGLFDTNQKALQSANINIMQQEFETMLNGNNGAVVPNGFTYTSAITGEVLGSGQQIPSTMATGDQLTQIEGDYVYTLMQDGFATLEEARAYYRLECENQYGMSWDELVDFYGNGDEELLWLDLTYGTGVGLTADTFVASPNCRRYWSVGLKYPIENRAQLSQTSYGEIYSELLGYSVTEFMASFLNCANMVTAPTIPNTVTHLQLSTFNGCTNLTSVNIPSSVIFIGQNVFYGCTSLTNITFEGSMAQWNAITFYDGSWNSKVPATYVQCSDGQVSLS